MTAKDQNKREKKVSEVHLKTERAAAHSDGASVDFTGTEL